MSYVKNYNPGQIRMDLPTANYIHELPLLSFGDIHGGVNLSLVFNYAMKAESSNPFNIAAGYKLNLQKRLIMENNAPAQFQDESGKCVDLIGNGFPYAFADDSQRILRQTTDPTKSYVIENPDFSTEEYYANGMIASVFDKYGTEVLRYEYDLNDGSDKITYKYGFGEDEDENTDVGKKIIVLHHGSNGLSAISFNGCSDQIVFAHTGTKLNVTLLDGTVCSLEPFNGMDFRATATATENGVTTSRKTQVVKDSEANTMTISDSIDNEVVNTTVYTFPEEPEHDNYCSQVDITDNRGAQTRIQFQNGKPLYSYEILNTDDWTLGTDSTVLETRFKGNVTIYGTQDNPGSHNAIGVQTRESGMTMHALDTNGQWLADMSQNQNAEGYYILSGWIKSNKIGTISSTISVTQSSLIPLGQWEIFLLPVGQWKYFSCMFYAPPCSICATITDSTVNQVDSDIHVADVRLSFQKTGVIEDGETTHTNMTEYILLNGDNEIPFKDATFYYSGSEGTITLEDVTVSDVLRRKLNHKKNGTCSEVYSNHCKKIDSGAQELYVSYGGTGYPISTLDVATKIYSQNNVYLTRMSIAETDTSSTDIHVQIYTNGVLTGVQKLNTYLDTIVSADIDAMTTYTRSNDLVTSETVSKTASLPNLTAGAALYNRYTIYDTTNAKITAANEFGYKTIYTLDPVWGTVKSVTLPNDTVVTDEYDTDMCALMKRTFGNATGRSNALNYVGGNLSNLQTGNLSYSFGYTEGKLIAVSKNNASIEEHTHTTTQTDSYYPTQASALHSTSAVFDKYGRLTSIPGVLTNVYDITPRFSDTTGALFSHGDNSSALLAMTTDEVQSETAKFTYTDNGQLAQKVVAKEADLMDEISKETFTYDAHGRLLTDICYYDQAAEKGVVGAVEYVPAASNPTNDSRVMKYGYATLDGSSVITENEFDELKRVTSKEFAIGHNVADDSERKVYTRTFTYNKTHLTRQDDTFLGNNVGAHSYNYDSTGRIWSDNYTSLYAPTDYRTYKYDDYGQLVRENNQGLDKTYVYEYNDIGNLTSVKAYDYTLSEELTGTPVTTTFGYTNDRLTSFGGATIGYNSMGCPTSYEGKTATWSKGKLSRLSQGTRFTGMSTYNYGYNGYGQRISRSYSYTAGTSGTGAAQLGQLTASSRNYYYDHAGRLIAEDVTKTYYGEGTTTENIVFLYDESGIIGMELTTGGATNLYYFQRNLQGDVVAIYDTNGALKAKYLYDAWGNCTISSETTSYDVANANPIRYRGYYYDDDTGLYYCNARYYSPKWRRFISPDDTSYLDPESVNGLNLYCYCNNDPVNYADPFGTSAILIAFAIGAVLGGIYGGISAAANGQNIFAGFVIGAVVGGLTGLITETASIPLMLLGTFFVGFGGDIASQRILDKKSRDDVNLISAAWTGVANAGLAIVGKGLSIADFNAGLKGLEKILFGTMTNSPLLGMGMAINMIVSKNAGVYTVAEAREDIAQSIYGLIWGIEKYGH